MTHSFKERWRAYWALLVPLTRRDIAGRYRGSSLGVLWSLLNPLLMLLVYAFVFGSVFQSRWEGMSGQPGSTSLVGFSVVLFTGLLVFQLFAEVVNRAPSLITAHANYVKKVVFPLELLPVVTVGSALFHAAIGFALVIAAKGLYMGGLPATVVLLPVVLLPLVLMTLGLAWLLAAVGTYLRDIGQVTASIVTALMFLSGVFFPRSALPEWMAQWVVFSPVTLPMEMAREVVVFGVVPDWSAYLTYSAVSILVAVLGAVAFAGLRRGFADVV